MQYITYGGAKYKERRVINIKDLEELTSKITNIKSKGWIKAVNNHTSGIGLTLEHELGVNSGDFEIPDYGQIELKTKKINSEPYTTLFNATPDSYLFEIKRIQEEYGYPHSKNPNFKVFNVSFDGSNYKSIGNKFLFILNVDWNKKIVILKVFDKYSKRLIDDKISWSFELLKEKLYRKLKYLMFIKAKRKYEFPYVYYKYTQAQFYILRSFDDFLKAIEQGNIRVTFKINAILNGKNNGKMHDHGTSFEIKETDLDKIFIKSITI